MESVGQYLLWVSQLCRPWCQPGAQWQNTPVAPTHAQMHRSRNMNSSSRSIWHANWWRNSASNSLFRLKTWLL